MSIPLQNNVDMKVIIGVLGRHEEGKSENGLFRDD